MQLIINIVFLVVLAIAFLGFWGLYLYLWKPKKLWPAWLAYILVVAGWFCAVRYYFLYQVDYTARLGMNGLTCLERKAMA